MTKENVLFTIVGLLAGLIIGFMGANSINQNAALRQGTGTEMGGFPPGHPAVPGGAGQMGANAPEVQAAIEKAKAEPDNYDAQMTAGIFFAQIGRFDGAVEYFKKANQIRPDAYDAVVQLGNSYFDSDNFVEAEKWYVKALSMKPDDVNVRTDLGLTFMFRQPADYDRAIKEFKASLEREPNHPQTLQNLTVAYTKTADAANAGATLARLESLDRSNPRLADLRKEIEKLKTK
ncbi:MAG: tetratricopeptide repeat protein [Pyrinomonadaceae bacterium]